MGHPFCAKNPVDTWPGEASRDEVHYLNGFVLERQFYRWIDGVGYDLGIGRHGGRTSVVSWRILPDTGLESTLRIAVYPHILQQLHVPPNKALQMTLDPASRLGAAKRQSAQAQLSLGASEERGKNSNGFIHVFLRGA